METNIQKALVIVNFSCERGGSGTKLDADHSAIYESENGIEKSKNGKAVSRTYIDIYGDAQETFKKPTKIYQRAWARHQLYTIAKSGKDSLIAVKTMDKHHLEMESFRQEFEDAVSEIIERFQEMKDNAIAKYNGKLDESDFPTVEHLMEKFSWRIERKPLPDSNAFDNALGSKELEEQIRNEVKETLTKTFNTAIQNVTERFIEHVTNIHKQLNGENAVADATLTNFAEFMEILPDMNVSGCPKIAKAYEDAKYLFKYDATATKDQSVKDELSSKSESILNDLTAIYGGK